MDLPLPVIGDGHPEPLIFDFLADEVLSVTFDGAPVTPAGQTSPYTIIRQS